MTLTTDSHPGEYGRPPVYGRPPGRLLTVTERVLKNGQTQTDAMEDTRNG